MTYFKAFKTGNLVLPAALLFHYKDIFETSDDFLVWQFFYLQNTTAVDEMLPSRIADYIGKTVSEVNQAMSRLTARGLLVYKTIELAGEVEAIFDATPALEKLDDLLEKGNKTASEPPVNVLKDLHDTFSQELGRLLSPFEIEDLTKMVEEDKIAPDLIKAALREAVFNGKTSWRYIQAILRNWSKEGITTVSQVEAKRQEREANNPQTVQVSQDFLAAMDLWSD